MKQCPSCDRTYSDDTISYCLADGALLSAPYDSQATQEYFASNDNTPPPPTIASPGVRNVEKRELVNTFGSKEKTHQVPWILSGVFVLIALVGVFIIGYKSGKQTTENLNGNSDTANTIANSPSDADPNANASNSGVGPASQAPENVRRIGNEGGGGPGPLETDKTVFKANEVTQKAKILVKPVPVYNEEARRNQVSGTVVLQMVLSSSGTVINIRTISGLPYGLTERAIEAARGIKFTPATKDGVAVSQYVKVEYNFNLH